MATDTGNGSRDSLVTRRWATRVGEVGVYPGYRANYTTEEWGGGQVLAAH